MMTFAPWQQSVYDKAVDALTLQRLGHAILFTGPGKLGKREVVESLARQALGATHDQRAAQFLDAGSHPDFHLIQLAMNKEGTRQRTEIVIDQIRELSEKLALTPQLGVAQVVIIDPADRINPSAANAPLKTLEEPHSDRYLWLIAEDPARLPATIRSRCQRFEFRIPDHDAALQWLLDAGFKQADALAALEAAQGHPGRAAEWLRDGGMDIRAGVIRDLSALAKPQANSAMIAKQWADDERLHLRLIFAANHALTLSRSQSLSKSQLIAYANWFDQVNRVRQLLQTTLRVDLLVTELLLNWAKLHASPHT